MTQGILASLFHDSHNFIQWSLHLWGLLTDSSTVMLCLTSAALWNLEKGPWTIHSCIFHTSKTSATWMKMLNMAGWWIGMDPCPPESHLQKLLYVVVFGNRKLLRPLSFISWKLSSLGSVPEGTLLLFQSLMALIFLTVCDSLSSSTGFVKLCSSFFLSKLYYILLPHKLVFNVDLQKENQ